MALLPHSFKEERLRPEQREVHGAGWQGARNIWLLGRAVVADPPVRPTVHSGWELCKHGVAVIVLVSRQFGVSFLTVLTLSLSLQATQRFWSYLVSFLTEPDYGEIQTYSMLKGVAH